VKKSVICMTEIVADLKVTKLVFALLLLFYNKGDNYMINQEILDAFKIDVLSVQEGDLVLLKIHDNEFSDKALELAEDIVRHFKKFGKKVGIAILDEEVDLPMLIRDEQEL
jgi:hypothetical protein